MVLSKNYTIVMFMLYIMINVLYDLKNNYTSVEYHVNGIKEGGWWSSNLKEYSVGTYECSGVPGATDC